MDENNPLTKYRYVELVLYMLANMCNVTQWITFSSVSTQAEQFYNTTSTQINGLSVCFLAIYPVGYVFALWLFTRYKFRVGILIGLILTVIGGWLRFISVYITNKSGAYGLLLFGQCLSALSQPIFLNCPAKVAARWFPVSQRDIATVCASMAVLIGQGIGTAVPPTFFVTDPDDNDLFNGFMQTLLFEALFANIVLALCLVGFYDKPKFPPSKSQEEAMRIENESSQDFSTALLQSLREMRNCFKERDMWILTLAFGIGLGAFNAFTTVILQITQPICATSDDAGNFGALLLGVGILGAFIFGYFMYKGYRYYRLLIFTLGMTWLMFIIFTILLRPNNIDAISALSALIGFFAIPILPLSFQAAAELTYPIPEDVSNGLLMTSGQVLGIPFIFILNALIPNTICDPNVTYPGSSIFMIIIIGLSFLSFCLFRGKNKRKEMELAGKIAESSSLGL